MGYSRETIKGAKPDSGNVDDAVATIRKLLQNTDAPRVARAGTAYTEGANRLKTLVEALEKVNQLLADEWHGKDAVTAQKNLQQMHATARHLRSQMSKFGEQLFAYGNDYLPYFRDTAYANSGATWNDDLTVGDWKTYSGKDARYTGEKAGHELVVTGSANGIAQTHLKMLNQRMVELWEKMPDILTSDLPEIPPVTPAPPPVQVPDYSWDPSKHPYNFDPSSYGKDGSGKDGSGTDGPSWPSSDHRYGDNGTGDSRGNGDTGGNGTGGNGIGGNGTGGANGNGDGNPGGSNVNGGDKNGGSPNGVTNPAGVAHPSVTDPTKGSRGTDLSQFHQPKIDPTSLTTPNSTSPHSVTHTPTGNGSPTSAVTLPNGFGAEVNPARMTRLASAETSATGGFYPPASSMHAGEEQEHPGTTTWLHQEDDVWGTDTPDARDHLIA